MTEPYEVYSKSQIVITQTHLLRNQLVTILKVTLCQATYKSMGNPKTPQKSQIITPTSMGGKERRAAVKVWKNWAESCARINLLRILIRDGIGLSKVEEFNLGIQSKFRSKKFQES